MPMLITVDLLYARGACWMWRENFEKQYPDGLNIEPLWSRSEHKVLEFWKNLIAEGWHKQFAWAWKHGILPPMTIEVCRSLSHIDLSGGDFSAGYLVGSRMHYCNLTDALFNEALMAHAQLRNVTCLRTSFSWADFSYADLTHADFCGVDMRYARLSGAWLEHAVFNGVDFWGATYDDETIFPAGFNPESENLVKVALPR